MLFSSMVFLWIFLPIVLLGYYVSNKQLKNWWLLITSLFFYAWGEPKYILLMLASIIINWGSGILIEKIKCKRIILIFNIFANIGLLGYFKYFQLFAVTLGKLLQNENLLKVNIALPIGISFFTFQALSYTIDLYRGKYPAQKNLMKLALYISFFPQLIAGPIVRYTDINEQIDNRSYNQSVVVCGFKRFIYGLGKKVILANTLALCADKIYALNWNELTGAIAWIGSVCYTLQIYYDFSGYSDMAIGLGKMFGFEFLENFNYPYKSKSITEFWRRWHISLGTWFREYLYIPLGGNRKGEYRTYFNLFIVFAITGFWHGANWNFLLWGCYYAFFIITERILIKNHLAASQESMSRIKLFLNWLYTILVVNFGWVFFRNDSLTFSLRYIKRMLMPWKYKGISFSIFHFLGAKSVTVIIISILGCGIVQFLIGKIKNLNMVVKVAEFIFCLFIILDSFALLAGNAYNPFIYFRF